MRLITTLLLIVALAVAPRAAAGAVEDAIAAFDSTPSAANANNFFNRLAEDDFLDENTHFSTSTPTDSLNRTVWYWASEWFYDCQDYDNALAYALKALPLYRYDDYNKADCLNITAIIYLRLGDFANAADYARRSVAIELRGDAHRRDIFIGIAIIIAIVAVALVLLYRHRRQRRALMREIAEIKRSINSTVTISNTPVDASESFRQSVVNAVNAGIASGNIGVAHLASQLNMSEQTFRRRVREATGDSPKMFITAIQMERAARLICEDIDRPISDVASLCGFDDASAFSHAFKRVYGCSPSQYRNSH